MTLYLTEGYTQISKIDITARCNLNTKKRLTNQTEEDRGRIIVKMLCFTAWKESIVIANQLPSLLNDSQCTASKCKLPM